MSCMSSVKRWMVDGATYVVNADDYDEQLTEAIRQMELWKNRAQVAVTDKTQMLEAQLAEAKRLLREARERTEFIGTLYGDLYIRIDAFLADRENADG